MSITNDQMLQEIFQKNHIKEKENLFLVWSGFFVLWHINLCRLFDVKAILLEEQ